MEGVIIFKDERNGFYDEKIIVIAGSLKIDIGIDVYLGEPKQYSVTVEKLSERQKGTFQDFLNTSVRYKKMEFELFLVEIEPLLLGFNQINSLKNE